MGEKKRQESEKQRNRQANRSSCKMATEKFVLVPMKPFNIIDHLKQHLTTGSILHVLHCVRHFQPFLYTYLSIVNITHRAHTKPMDQSPQTNIHIR